MSLQRQNK